MAEIKPFLCTRPKEEFANRVAALPYDVFNREEAKQETKKEPMSFLKVDRAETQLEDDIDIYDKRVYQKAKELLKEMEEEEILFTEQKEYYFIYELTMNERSQTGIVACASIDDYLNNNIKKHENTRAEKEEDRIRHVDICSAQTGPIFLAYRSNIYINQIVEAVKKEKAIYDFTAADGVRHTVWRVEEENNIEAIERTFASIQEIYIADGHHRAASAIKVGLKRRKEHNNYDGTEAFNYFLSVLFPDDQLMILDYNRVVKDLNGWTKEEFLQKIEENFIVKIIGKEEYHPQRKHEFGMYIEGQWYCLTAKEKICIEDPIKGLDVSILQDYLLSPILGIENPKTDNRIDFIGGIRGLKELKRRVEMDMKVGFAMYPTSIQELFQVADAGLLMPPKSTWFEPKLRSGLFIHKI